MKLVLTAPADVYRWEEEDEDEEAYSEDEEGNLDDDAFFESEDEEDDEFDEESALEFEIDEEIDDPDILSELSGIEYDGKLFSEFLSENAETETLKNIISGGVLGFEFSEEDQLLWGYTEYNVTRELSDDELQLLIDFTIAQWSDGIGQDFAGDYAEESGYFIQINPPDDEVSYYYEEEDS